MADMSIRKINVTKSTWVHTGENKNGNEYNIFEIEGETENGTAITKKMSSFDDLPLGLNEYEVEPFKEKLTLKPHGWKAARTNAGPGPSAAGPPGASKAEFDSLKQRVANLEARVLGSDVTPPVGGPADDWASAPADGSDDDIPF